MQDVDWWTELGWKMPHFGKSVNMLCSQTQDLYKTLLIGELVYI